MDRTADGRAGAPLAGIGAALPRLEDERFLTGRGRYVADIALAGMAHACVVRAPHAHARIRSVDTAAARAAPGVLLVLTGADAAREGLGHLTCPTIPPSVAGAASQSPPQPILATDKARHVGDRIAFVVAETLEAARDAAERVAVDYAPLPPVTASDAALAPGAPLVWDEAPGNLCYRIARGDRKATDAAFARAAHVTRLDFHYPRASAASIEPRASVADTDPARRRVTLYATTQAPFRVREVLAGAIFKVPQTDLRVIAPDVGGGFGAKGPVYPEDALTVWAARTLGRPVKWVSDRAESLASDSHGRDQRESAELAFDQDGRILALRARAILDVGSYLVMSAGVPGLVAMHSWTSVYHVPEMYAEITAAFTNTPPIGPYRGTSRPECTFVIERLVDKAAREMGIDGIALRRRNMISVSAMPYTTHGHQTYDAGDFARVLERALEGSNWSGFPARRDEARRRGRLRGIGLCMHVESAGLYGERMELRVDSGGGVTVQAGTMATGQGHETMYAQLVAGWLGVPVGRVRVMQGDTDQVLFGRGTFAERSAMTGGSALKGAVEEVVRNGRRLAAHMLEAAESDVEFADGSFRVAGTDRAVPFAAVARFAHTPMGLPEGAGLGLDGAGSFAGVESFPNGCMVCEVEIDPETGALAIDRFFAVDDVGAVINPLMLDGQVHGSIAQGVGQVLAEEIRFDPATGQLLTGSFLDYAMPRAGDFPSFATELVPTPTATNPLGVKGGAESGVIAGPPAVVNAIVDALAPLGVTDVPMPATPERLWRAIAAAKA